MAIAITSADFLHLDVHAKGTKTAPQFVGSGALSKSGTARANASPGAAAGQDHSLREVSFKTWSVSSNPVAPTLFGNEPFGENVEGLSHCGDGSCGSQIMFK